MGSVLLFHEPVHLWSMFVRLTESTVAWSVHLRPGCRDYSLSLSIKSGPFQPAGLVLCDSACLSKRIVSLVSATVCTAQRNITLKLHCSTLTLGLDELHGKTVKSWNWGPVMLAACSSRLHAWGSGFLSPFLPSVLDLFLAVALDRGAGIRTGVSLSVAARCSRPVRVGELQSRNFPMRISKIIQCRGVGWGVGGFAFLRNDQETSQQKCSFNAKILSIRKV